MPRYVILEHDHPQLHWDLMLEDGDTLRTWRLLAAPEPGQTVAAETSFPHRRLYLDYEGPVSGGRGRVMRWDEGIFTPLEESPSRLVLQLEGRRRQGLAVLAHEADGWYFTYEED